MSLFKNISDVAGGEMRSSFNQLLSVFDEWSRGKQAQEKLNGYPCQVTSPLRFYIKATLQGETSFGMDYHQILCSKEVRPLDYLALLGIIVNLWWPRPSGIGSEWRMSSYPTASTAPAKFSRTLLGLRNWQRQFRHDWGLMALRLLCRFFGFTPFLNFTKTLVLNFHPVKLIIDRWAVYSVSNKFLSKGSLWRETQERAAVDCVSQSATYFKSLLPQSSHRNYWENNHIKHRKHWGHFSVPGQNSASCLNPVIHKKACFVSSAKHKEV